jgi:hypothetical protein
MELRPWEFKRIPIRLVTRDVKQRLVECGGHAAAFTAHASNLAAGALEFAHEAGQHPHGVEPHCIV